jgi:adenylate kinase family enzyme
VRRINVKGISGSGKTTFARELARRLALPYLELDALNHRPNWQEATDEELRASVRDFMRASPGGWVIDGNYERKLGDLVLAAADTAVWLDPPLLVALRRLRRRTAARIRNDEALWSGNRESWRNALWGRESLFVWTIRSWIRHRREWPRRLATYRNLHVIRLRSAAEADDWLADRVGVPEPAPEE